MDNLNKLRLLAFQKVTEDENLCCSSVKKQVLNYMKEADEHDVKAYLLDGDLDIVEEDAKQIIDERFERSEIKKDLENAIQKLKKRETQRSYKNDSQRLTK